MAQTNPFVAGLNAWAGAMDPADQAKGRLASQSLVNSGLEGNILQDRILARNEIMRNQGITPEVRSFLRANDSFSPSSAQTAYRADQAANIFNNPNSTMRDMAAASLGRGDPFNEINVSAIQGLPIGNTPTPHTMADGQRVVFIPDSGQPNGFRMENVGAAPSTDTVIVPSGGQAFTKTPQGLVPQQVIKPMTKPITAQQLASVNAVNARATIGGGFEGVESEVGKALGYIDQNGMQTGRPQLNTFQLNSVVRLANEYIANGYLTSASIQKSLEDHGITRNNLVEREFEGGQNTSPWYDWNPQMAVESQAARPEQTFSLPLPDANTAKGLGNDAKMLTTENADFYDEAFNPTSKGEANDLILNKDLSKRPKIKERFEEKGYEPMPLTAVSRLTNLGDDILGATTKPIRAKVYSPGLTIKGPGEFFVKVDQSGKRTYGISADDNGQLVIMWE